MAEVLTIGETMVIFQPLQVGNLEDNVPIQQRIGGAESNFAIGLSRLGHDVKYITRLGNDPFGKRILKTLLAERVDVSDVTLVDGERTGLLFKEQKLPDLMNVNYYRENSAASRMNMEQLTPKAFEGVKFLHVTGITPAISQSCRELIFEAIKQAKRYGVRITFDPNLRFKLWPKQLAFEVLNEIARQADYLLVSEEEGRFLTNETDVLAICQKLAVAPHQVVVMKCGDKPTILYTQQEWCEIETFHVAKIVDSVGAGDGFAAGFTHGLLTNVPLKECVNIGNFIGSRVIQQYGDIEGLPYADDLAAIGNKQTDNVVR